MTLVDQYTADIQKLCAQYKVKHLYAFGSVLTKSFGEKSDIDFLVDFNPIELDHYSDNYFNLKFALENLLKRKIDLLEEKAIKNPFFKTAIENRRHLVYGN